MSTQLNVKTIKTLQMTFYTGATVGRHLPNINSPCGSFGNRSLVNKVGLAIISLTISQLTVYTNATVGAHRRGLNRGRVGVLLNKFSHSVLHKLDFCSDVCWQRWTLNRAMFSLLQVCVCPSTLSQCVRICQFCDPTQFSLQHCGPSWSLKDKARPIRTYLLRLSINVSD